MNRINVAVIKKEIAAHEKQIALLRKLLDFASLLDKGTSPSAPSEKVRDAVKRKNIRKTTAGKRAKRGSVSSAIIAHLNAAKKPSGAAEVKKALVDKKIIGKESKSIYSQLQQMAAKGAIKKAKGKRGVTYESKK